jgi:hypothetical protein
VKRVRRLSPIVAAVTLAILIFPTAALLKCGTERGDVKNVLDGDGRLLLSGRGLKRAKRITIKKMYDWDNPFPNPKGIPHSWYSKRYLPYEANIYVLEDVTLVEYVKENDEDYHLVLRDGEGNTMIAEIPNPRCVAGAPDAVRKKVQIARDDFDRQFGGMARPVLKTFKEANVRVRIAGVAMFDKIHGGDSGEQRGVAPNGIELHPVLGIEFPGIP